MAPNKAISFAFVVIATAVLHTAPATKAAPIASSATGHFVCRTAAGRVPIGRSAKEAAVRALAAITPPDKGLFNLRGSIRARTKAIAIRVGLAAISGRGSVSVRRGMALHKASKRNVTTVGAAAVLRFEVSQEDIPVDVTPIFNSPNEIVGTVAAEAMADVSAEITCLADIKAVYVGGVEQENVIRREVKEDSTLRARNVGATCDVMPPTAFPKAKGHVPVLLASIPNDAHGATGLADGARAIIRHA